MTTNNDLALGQGAVGIISGGETLKQITSGFQTAVSVQQPRDIDRIVKALDKDSEYAGEFYYYSWMVTDKNGKKVPVEGLSYHGQIAIAREFGNCAIVPLFEETNDAYIFSPTFIDIERGYNFSRIYKQSKTKAPGKYGAERWADMQMQSGQSKAIRNVVKGSIPEWLQQRVFSNAKKAVLNNITKLGLAKATDKALNYLKQHGISEQQVIDTLGKTIADFTVDDIAILRGLCRQIEDGTERADDLFTQTPAQKHKEDVIKTQDERKADVEKTLTADKDINKTDVQDGGTGPNSDERGGRNTLTFGEYKSIVTSLAGDVDGLKKWWNENREQAEKDLVPRSFVMLTNYYNSQVGHIESEDANVKPAMTLEQYAVEIKSLDKGLDISRLILRRDDEYKRDLTPDEYNQIQQLANDHIIECRKNSTVED
jgi:hypothetical protein